MTYASSKYLTHKYPVWEGCTIAEITIISGISLSACLVGLFILGVIFNHVHLFLLGIIPALLTVPKLAVRQLAELKKDRPYGFAIIHIRLLLEKHVGIATPYLSRVGRWSTKQ